MVSVSHMNIHINIYFNLDDDIIVISCNHDAANCPCNSQGSTQSFVGNDYFCESGNPNYYSQSKLYTCTRSTVGW